MALRFSILSPHAEVERGEAKQLTATGSEGEFGVLEHHTPFATMLRPGRLTLEYADGARKHFYVRSGFAQTASDEVVVLADEIIAQQDLNEEAIRQALNNEEGKDRDAYEAQLAVLQLN